MENKVSVFTSSLVDILLTFCPVLTIKAPEYWLSKHATAACLLSQYSGVK